MGGNFKYIKFLSGYKKEIFILFLLSLLASGFSLAGPFFSKLFIDNAFIARNFEKFLRLSIWGAVVFAAVTLSGIAQGIIKNRIAVKLKLRLSNSFMKKFYSLDMEFFQNKSVGENAYRLSDTDSITNFMLEQLPDFMVDVVKLPVILVVCLWLNARMTVFLLLLSPLFLVYSLYLQRKLSPIYEKMWGYSSRLSGIIYEAFSKMLIVKAFGLENYQRRVYFKSLIENIRWNIINLRWTIVGSVSSSLLSKAVYGAIALYGGWLIIKGNLTLGSYTAVVIYLNQLGGLLQSFGNKIEYLAQEMVSVRKFFEIMDMQPMIKDAPGSVELKRANGSISFENIWFGYQKDKAIFKGMNFTMPAYSWIGIVGPSGCGKTTLINLILRLYEPEKGRVLLDSIELNHIRLKSLRSKAAIATQQPLLFDMSIKENIAYGLKNIDMADVINAARIACIDGFINQLPAKYDTLAGQDACRLSQGFKQRVAIARAIARKPDLLILDEATSSIDSYTEEKVFKALKEARHGLSTIVISHRLFSVRDADRIYFLRQDAGIEEGTHSGLMSASPYYREFFHNQLNEEQKKEYISY